MTFVLGLTGSIGMGKSTIAKQLRFLGARISDADAIVHQLMRPTGKAFAKISQRFPEAMREGQIDRGALGKIVFQNPEARAQLEAILHPLVRQAHRTLIQQAKHQHWPLVVLEIPLLYETGGEQPCDAVAVVTAPAFIQRQRALKRPGMTHEKLARILAVQTPDAVKRQCADIIIHTGLGKAVSFRQVRQLVSLIHHQKR